MEILSFKKNKTILPLGGNGTDCNAENILPVADLGDNDIFDLIVVFIHQYLTFNSFFKVGFSIFLCIAAFKVTS